jgi:deoxycytidine triphosphate deaminase
MQVNLDVFLKEVRAIANADGLPSPQQRYDALATFDPYPEIPPALLHSGHLASYAITTGMIDPFESDALEKPATYLVPLEGPVRFLDSENSRQSFYLSNTEVQGEADVRPEFELMPNSLCYVTLRPMFRLPAYIAGRFNLLIRDVYRGLLVGTGPLVDPGFTGHLSIPVHNFTSNKYLLRAGEGFVYFEFTKLAWVNPKSSQQSRRDLPAWVQSPIQNQPPFPGSKSKRRNIDDYLLQATGGEPAQNAIQSSVQTLANSARQAQTKSNIITGAAIIAAMLFVLATMGVIMGAIQLYLGAQQFSQSAQSDVNNGFKDVSNRIIQLQSEVKDLKRDVQSIHQNLPNK